MTESERRRMSGRAIPNRVDEGPLCSICGDPVRCPNCSPPDATRNRVDELAEVLWRGDPCDAGEHDDWPDNVDVGRYLYMAEQALRWMRAT